jgi:hypothetical protein
MAVEGMRRLTFVEQVSRNAGFKGRGLALEICGPKGFGTRAAEASVQLVLAAKDVQAKFYTPLGRELNATELIGMKPAEIDAMAAEIDALSQSAIARGSQIKFEMLDDPRLPFKVAREFVLGSLSNGRKVAAEINGQTPGRKVRIPTEAELLQLNRLLGSQLEGNHLWIWTETEHEDYPGQFVLRHQDFDYRICDRPGDYCLNYAVRFVEDK